MKNIISSSGRSVSFIAIKLGISRESLYNKMNGVTEFKASEIVNLTKLLNLSKETRDDIFFN